MFRDDQFQVCRWRAGSQRRSLKLSAIDEVQAAPRPFGSLTKLTVPCGAMGDPQQFADALRQFADMLSYRGGPALPDVLRGRR